MEELHSLFTIHSSIATWTARSLTNTPTEAQGIAIKGDDEVHLYNVYIPPVSSCSSGFRPQLDELFNSRHAIIMGDFNAHHSTWRSALAEDTRSQLLAYTLDSKTCVVLKGDEPTRAASNGTLSSPDITIASASLATTANWSTETALNSDHKPIIVELQIQEPTVNSERRKYVNFAKADWDGFKSFMEDSIQNLPQGDLLQSERAFRNKMQKAARKFIPNGRISTVQPGFPTAAAKLADETNKLRAQNPAAPQINEMNKKIRDLVEEHRREKWTEHLEKCDLRSGVKCLWNTIKTLSGNVKKTESQAITFKKPVYDPKEIANKFNQQYTPPIRKKVMQETRQTLRNLKTSSVERAVITTMEVETVLQSTKPSKALSPDELSPLMLKHLGPKAHSYIAGMFQTSLNTGVIPSIWKTARIIPLLKTGKPDDTGKSYRPVSLLSPLVKALETLLLPTLTEHLPMADHQHGFRKGRSTTTALYEIDCHITRGLNKRRPVDRTILVALDFRAAFDTVTINKLLNIILASKIPKYTKRWHCSYLRGSQTYVEFRNAKSTFRKVRAGALQGGVLSPILFNAYMSGLPTPPEGIKLTSYADDCTSYASGPTIPPICEKLNSYLTTLHECLEEHDLELSPGKSTATVFTTFSQEVSMSLPIKIGQHTVPTTKIPKILGVTLDSLHTFNAHSNNTLNKIRKRNSMLRALAGSSWGKDKELLTTTYKPISRSVVNYAAPIWTPALRDTHWSKLQAAQNLSSRVITGCTKMTHIDELHRETTLLPVKEHNTMLSRQFLLQTHQRNHPNRQCNHTDPPQRLVKPTLISCHQDSIEPLLTNTEGWYKSGIKSIHTTAVNNTINGYEPNKVLQSIPPVISPDERRLPRSTRTTLAQLRSGYCPLLTSYMSQLDPIVKNECSLCESQPHDKAHLFRCPQRPTTLEATSLWENPIEAAPVPQSHPRQQNLSTATTTTTTIFLKVIFNSEKNHRSPD